MFFTKKGVFYEKFAVFGKKCLTKAYFNFWRGVLGCGNIGKICNPSNILVLNLQINTENPSQIGVFCD